MKNLNKMELLILIELVNKQKESNQMYYKSVRNPEPEYKKRYIKKVGELNRIYFKLRELLPNN